MLRPILGMIRIGVSGWSYESWKGVFYPEGLRPTDRLAWVLERLDTVEANGPFYRLLNPGIYRAWYEAAPPHARLSVKGGRHITHNLKLRGARRALANFLASGVLALGEKLGPLLWQLPARLHFGRDRLGEFLELLPRDTASAARLAREHDERIEQPFLEIDANHRMRHVLEPRHESFFTPEAIGVLRSSGIALAVSHAGDWPMCEEVTAGFVYIRLHGSPHTYASRYAPADLDDWARKVTAWARGTTPRGVRAVTGRAPPARKSRDVYVYFDNDAHGHAPFDAQALVERVRRRGGRSPPAG